MERFSNNFQTIAMMGIAAIAIAACSEEQEPWIPVIGNFTPDPDPIGPGTLCPAGSPDLFNNAHSPHLGGTVAPNDLEVVVVANFACPHCAHFAEEIHTLWSTRQDYRERVRLYFHHYPFSPQYSWESHGATVAAFNQGNHHFWAMHDYIYAALGSESRKVYSQSELYDYAANTLKLNMVEFDEQMDSATTYGVLNWDRNQAIAADVTGTPAVFICGQRLTDRSRLSATIDHYLTPLQ